MFHRSTNPRLSAPRPGTTNRDRPRTFLPPAPPLVIRWTLDEGRDAISEAVPPTHPFTALNSSKTSRSDLDHEGRAGGGGGQVRAGSQERWALSDGAADLEERGIKTYGAGLYLPSSSSSSPPGLNSGLGAGMAVVGVASARAGKRRRQSRDVQDEADVSLCCFSCSTVRRYPSRELKTARFALLRQERHCKK